MLIIGIDPGKKGSIACNRAELIDFLPLDQLALTIYKYPDALVFVESVTASPKMGVVSAFTFGKEFGKILGILEAFRANYKLVKPQMWQGRLGLSFPGQNIDYREKKKRCYEAAKEMFPGIKVTKDNADALLIMEYGRRALTESSC